MNVMKSIVFVWLALIPLFHASAQEVAVGICPNYTIDGLTGEALCQVDVRPGETIFYWDADRNGFAEKAKHAFVMNTPEGRTIQFAAFNWYNSNGTLYGQAWTGITLDDWVDVAKDTDGDGFFESFCKYEGGMCQPVTACAIPVVKEHHDQMVKYYNAMRESNNPLAFSYASEIYTRADKWLKYCTFIESRRGPRDERENLVP